MLKGIIIGAGVLASLAIPVKASITLGVKIIGGTGGTTVTDPTDATITNVGDTVTLQIYATVSNADSNNNDEAFSLAKYAFQSLTSGAGAIQGTFSGLTFAGASNPSFSTTGTAFANQDPGGAADPLSNDFWAGSNTNTAAAQFQTGTSPTWGDGSNSNTSPATSNGGAGPTTFVLGTITWTATSNQNGLAVVSYALPHPTSGASSNKNFASYVTDAGLSNAAPTFTSAIEVGGLPPSNLTLAPGVIISVPEPTSLGLLGMGLAALGFRSRRKTA